MASARSTVSIARTTPAQKPRGEQSTILRSGLTGIKSNLEPNHPSPAGGERSIQVTTWDCFSALSRHFLGASSGKVPPDIRSRREPGLPEDIVRAEDGVPAWRTIAPQG